MKTRLKFILILLIVMLSLSVNAIKPDKTYELSEVDQQPEFPGGDTAMYKWIADSLTWDSDVYLSGRVIVEFCIAEDGTVEDVRIKRGIYPPFDDMILKKISSMPKWRAATISGKPVKVTRILPIKIESPKHQ